MKKVLLTTALFVAAVAANATSRSWNFTSWSEATVTNLKADAAASIFTGWSDVEKDPTKEGNPQEPTEVSKDNCFWFQGTVDEDGSISANGEVIAELKGLKFDATYAGKRSLAIAVNYQEPDVTKDFGPYAGAAYLWLGGKNSECFSIPNVIRGTTITMEVESHKTSDGRGVELYAKVGDNSTKIGETFTPTAKDTYTWTVDEALCDVVIKNTNGCHIYSITLDEPVVNINDGTITQGGDLYDIVSMFSNIGNLKITLEAGASYTISNTLKAGGDITIIGNGATIDASGMTKPFITLEGSETFAKKLEEGVEVDSDHKLIASVAISGVTINGLQNSLIKDNQKTLVEELIIDNSVIEMPASGKSVLDFNGKGYAGMVVVNNSTIYAKDKNTGFFAQYGSRPKNLNGDWNQVFDFQNSTIVNIANGKNFNDLKQNGTAQNVYSLKNCIFVDCGKNNQVVVGFNKGQTSATPIWDVTGNYFACEGACSNAAEIEKAGQQSGEDIVKDCVDGTLTFTDAANGNFNGEFEVEGTAPESLGDPRWTIAFKAAAPKPILTLSGPVGEEVNIQIGVWDEEDIFSVDFGDGTLQEAKVGIDNKGPKQEDGSTPVATKFTGTVAGDGTIKVYGNNDIWYLNCSGGAIPTSFDQPKLMNVVQMNITGADVETVELPAYEKMTQFNFNNSSAKSIDVSKVTGLTSLSINSTSASKFEPQLESIDLSKNVNLETLNIQGNQNASGKLKSLDLSNNTKLKGMGLYVQYNQIETLTLPETWAPDEETETQTFHYGLTALNVQNNKLTSLPFDKLPDLKSLYAANNLFEGELDLSAYESLENVQLNGNQLTGVKVQSVTKQFYVNDNKLTLATIPAQPAAMNTKNKTKQFTYAPQAALEVAETVNELDLSAQANVAQGELDPADYATYLTGATIFSFVNEEGTALAEGTDYQVTAPGKFKFLTEQTLKIHGVMLNAAFPKFTETVPFVTTEFSVSASTGINDLSRQAKTGKVYNLQGLEVKQPAKGLYIQNGRKMMVK